MDEDCTYKQVVALDLDWLFLQFAVGHCGYRISRDVEKVTSRSSQKEEQRVIWEEKKKKNKKKKTKKKRELYLIE